MKSNRLYLIAALSPILVLAAAAQTPPPPPVDVSAPPAPSTVQVQGELPATHISRVNAVAYGPEGEVVALTLRNGVAVTLTPDLGMQLQSSVSKGTRIQVSGLQRVIAGQTSLIAQSLTANGQTFVAAPPTPPERPDIVGGAPPRPPAGALGPGGPRGPRGQGAPPPPPSPAGATPPPPPQM
jgi:hypothetical protein